MRKKSALLLGVLFLMLSACQRSQEVWQPEWNPIHGVFPVAFLGQAEGAQPQSFVSDAWAGVVAYCGESEQDCACYVPRSDSLSDRLHSIDQAISLGAEVLVCPEKSDETAVYVAQKQYPQTLFLLVGGEPHSQDDQSYETTANTHCLCYRVEEGGYLAGWAAVQEGYRSLGFCAEGKTALSLHYGYGFLQGAEEAGKQLGLAPASLSLRYWYAPTESDAVDRRETRLSQWYAEGCQLVFSCGKTLSEQALSAARATGGKVIAAECAPSFTDPALLAREKREAALPVMAALRSLCDHNGAWDGQRAGQTCLLGAGEMGISLSSGDRWRWQKFTPQEYLALLTKLRRGEVSLPEQYHPELFPTTECCVVSYEGKG